MVGNLAIGKYIQQNLLRNKMTKEELLEVYQDVIGDEEILTADGFDDAIIGLDSKSLRVIYDTDLMVNILMAEGMEEMDAVEHLEYNVLNAWVGDRTPIYMI